MQLKHFFKCKMIRVKNRKVSRNRQGARSLQAVEMEMICTLHPKASKNRPISFSRRNAKCPIKYVILSLIACSDSIIRTWHVRTHHFMRKNLNLGFTKHTLKKRLITDFWWNARFCTDCDFYPVFRHFIYDSVKVIRYTTQTTFRYYVGRERKTEEVSETFSYRVTLNIRSKRIARRMLNPNELSG